MTHRSYRIACLVIFCVFACFLVACDSERGTGEPQPDANQTGNDGSGTLTSVPQEEDPHPDFTVNACDGSPVSIGEWAADYDAVFITYAAKWCQACAKEVPMINEEIVQAMAGRSVAAAQILVEQDPGQAAQQALCQQWDDEYGAEFPILVDPDENAVAAIFGESVGSQLPLQTVIYNGKIILRSYTATITEVAALLDILVP